jgi:hypothetical protein
MLYFKALLEGWPSCRKPTRPRARRSTREAATRGWPALHAELAKVDPETAARLHPTDAQRIQRALEVFRLAGRPLSATARRGENSRSTAIRLRRRSACCLPTAASCTQRIAERFDAMLNSRAGRRSDDAAREVRAARSTCRRCAASATDRYGKSRTAWLPRAANCATAASTPPASWPSARSPGSGQHAATTDLRLAENGPPAIALIGKASRR